MDIEAITWFARVVDCGSFAAAARQLQQPASTVSRRVARLEESLGNKLLSRTTRSIALTDEGEQLIGYARNLVALQQQVEDWRDSRQNIPTGTLRITSPSGFSQGPLATWMINFRQRYPQVKTELIHSNEYLDFQQHRLDIAFRQGPLPSTSLVAKRILGIQWGVFASPEWAQRYSAIKTPEDLNHAPVIAIGVRGQTLPWRFNNQNCTPQSVEMMFEDSNQCLQAAVAGIGCTYAARYDALPLVNEGKLVELLADARADAADFYMVMQSREHRPLKSTVFIEHIEKEIADFGQPEGIVW
jgi:DNA-binding transcriptional LysR family regulator